MIMQDTSNDILPAAELVFDPIHQHQPHFVVTIEGSSMVVLLMGESQTYKNPHSALFLMGIQSDTIPYTALMVVSPTKIIIS